MEDLEKIYFYFYENLYQHKEILEDTLREVLEGLPSTFTEAMNDSMSQEITERTFLGKILCDQRLGRKDISKSHLLLCSLSLSHPTLG